jgi:hypothetical protein
MGYAENANWRTLLAIDDSDTPHGANDVEFARKNLNEVALDSRRKGVY